MGMKGYIRTTEAVIAIVLLFFLYYSLTARLEWEIVSKRELESLASSILTSIAGNPTLERYASEYNYKELDGMLSSLVPEGMGYAILIEQEVEIELIENTGNDREDEVFFFTYNFPRPTDPASIELNYKGKWIEREARFIWYEIPFILLNRGVTIADRVADLGNFTLIAEGVSNRTLSIFCEGGRVELDFDWHQINSSAAVARVRARIPYLEGGKRQRCSLFYSTNLSMVNYSYPSLSAEDLPLHVEKGAPSSSSRAEVLFKIPLLKGWEKAELKLIYRIGTREKGAYSKLGEANNYGIVLRYEDRLRIGTSPLRAPIGRRAYTAEQLVETGEGSMRIKLFLWYP